MNKATEKNKGGITIRYIQQGDENARLCSLCGDDVSVWDMISDLELVQDSGALVCTKCAGENAPEVFKAWQEVARWAEEKLDMVWERGKREGQRIAGRKVLQVISETPLDRIKKICRFELDPSEPNTSFDDVPF